jgi:hypothetical protein
MTKCQRARARARERRERQRERERDTHTHTKEATRHISNKKHTVKIVSCDT